MAEVVYSGLKEEEEQIPSLEWEKDTIQYVLKNKSKVIKVIRSTSRGMINLNSMDIEDIYSSVLLYMYNSGDYDIQRAAENSNSGTAITLEGYVNSSIKFCVKRYITETYKREKGIVRDNLIDEEGNRKDIFELIPDEESTKAFDNVGDDIRTQLRNVECIRYKYGPDLFMVLYVRLLTMNSDIKGTSYRKILEVLGVSKKELSELERKTANDEDVIQTIKLLSMKDYTIAARILEEYVYCAKKIKDTINLMK